ncbi:MAG TPA: iron ABC transporter permease, partial [Acidimicrobiales bacterium]|nr:iron ABC transporter permease [Acidimicrobiales bacterium]
LTTIAALAVAAASLAPFVSLILGNGVSPSSIIDEFAKPGVPQLVWHTIELALGVSVAGAVLGVGLALLVVRTNLPFRRLFTVLFVLPLSVPGFVGSFTWVALSLRFAPESRALFSYGGAVLVLTLATYPYIFLSAVAALRGIDPAQEEAARSLGHGPVGTFLRVTLPHLRPAIALGGLIVALHMFAEFGALQMLGFPTLTTAIVQRMTVFGDPDAARALSVVLAVVSVLVIALDAVVRGRVRPARTGAGTPRTPRRWSLGWSRPFFLGVSILVVLAALGVPAFAAGTGLARSLGPNGPGIPWAELADVTFATTRLGLAAALVATVVGFPIAYVAARHPGVLSTLAERGIWIAHSLPGAILALSLVYVGVNWLHPLYLTTMMLVIAYVIMFLPLAVSSEYVGFARAARSYEQIARSLGDTPLVSTLRITLPLALPGVAVGALLVLIEVEKELTTTLLLHPTGTDTLSTALWATTNGEVLDFTAAAPYGVTLMILAAIPAAILARRTLAQVD